MSTTCIPEGRSRFSITLDDDLLQEVDRFRSYDELKRSDVVAAALSAYFDGAKRGDFGKHALMAMQS